METTLTARQPGKAESPFASAGVHHVAMRVPDLEASMRWFREKLDFRVVKILAFREHRLAWLSPAGDAFILELIGGNSPEPNPEFASLEESLEYAGFHHLCLDVDDVKAATAELRRRGANVIGDTFEIIELQRRHVFVSDPWGNMIELGQAVA